MADHFVCRCSAYRFPHEIARGRCDGTGWLTKFHNSLKHDVCDRCDYHGGRSDSDCWCDLVADSPLNLTLCPGYVAEARRQGVKLK